MNTHHFPFLDQLCKVKKKLLLCVKKLYTIVDCILLMIELRLCKTKLIILSFENWTIKHRIYLIFNKKTIINNIFESILQVYISILKSTDLNHYFHVCFCRYLYLKNLVLTVIMYWKLINIATRIEKIYEFKK